MSLGDRALAKHQLPAFMVLPISVTLPFELEMSPAEEASSTDGDNQSPWAALGWQPAFVPAWDFLWDLHKKHYV